MKWIVDIGTLHISLIDTIYDAVSYAGDIIGDSFSGISMRWNISGNGLIAPNEVTFDVSNIDGYYDTSDFAGQDCLITLVVDDSPVREHKFVIEKAIEHYGRISCYCVDFVSAFLEGDYPNTRNPKEIWRSDDIDEDNMDDYCVPIIFGTAYIPVRSINTGSDRYYVLGESGPTYTVYEVRSPRSWPNTSIWAAASYTMTGSVNSGYQLLQPIIADSDLDGTADAPGLWRSGDTFYDMLCRLSRSDTDTITNPADCIEYVLGDFGVDSGDIDATSFTAAASSYTTQGLSFVGGLWRKTPRESALSNMLSHVDSFLKSFAKVQLHQFSATPRETITDVLKGSFRPSKITQHQNDSGKVQWPEATDAPMDVLTGKAVVPTYSSGPETEPSGETLKCRFFAGENIISQKAGILYFQKRFDQNYRVSFSVGFSSLVNQGSLSPGDVVTVNDSIYGGSQDVIITEMRINQGLRVDFTGVVLNHLEDWSTIGAPSAKSIITDASDGWEIAATNENGDLGGEWSLLLNIPDRFKENASLGLNVTDSYLGYYDGSNFQSYISSTGLFQFRGDTNNFINWNGTSLNVKGVITVVAGSNVDPGADVTADNGQDYTWVTGTKPPTNADNTTTEINGGVITTGYIRDSSSNLVIDFDDATITVNNPDGLTIESGNIGCYNGTTKVGSIEYNSTVSAFRFHAPSGPAVVSSENSYVNIVASYDVSLWSDHYVNLKPNASYWVSVYGDMLPSSDDTYDLGSSSRVWKQIHQADAFVEDTIQHSSGNSEISFASDDIDLDSGGDIFLDAATGGSVYFAIAGTNKAYFSSSAYYPYTSDAIKLGGSANLWSECWATAFYDDGGGYNDELDDLYELSQIKPRYKKQKDPVTDEETQALDRHPDTGLMQLDNNSLPKWMNTYDEAAQRLRNDCGCMVTEDDIVFLLDDYEEAGWMICRNVALFADLTSGAVRQLDTDVLAMFEMLSSRITKLEKGKQ